MPQKKRDHGGGLDAAARIYGGIRGDWLDLSTGINPSAYPLPTVPETLWTALPDEAAQQALVVAARQFWNVPEGADILATPGASAPIAMIPRLAASRQVHIATPTYNEHAAAFDAAGWALTDDARAAQAQVVVHPNNPDGRRFSTEDLTAPLRIIDESFCDVMPDASLITEAACTGTLVLKSFGKFWGLAGLRLGFVIGDPALVGALRDMLGPWPVSGPALEIGRVALRDDRWANETRSRLATDAAHLDDLMHAAGASCLGGTTLFRLYDVADAAVWQDRLAQHHIWSRIFPYNPRWLRLGLPDPDSWSRVAQALT